jgi:hypothetical protein
MDVVIYWGFVWIALFCMVLVKAYELPPFVLGFNSNLFEKWMRFFFLRKNNIKIWVLGPVEWSICCCCFFIMYILLNENRHYYFYSFVYFNVQFTDYFELHLLKSVQGSTTPKHSYYKQLFYSILQIETNYYSRCPFKVFLYFKLIWIDKMEIITE